MEKQINSDLEGDNSDEKRAGTRPLRRTDPAKFHSSRNRRRWLPYRKQLSERGFKTGQDGGLCAPKDFQEKFHRCSPHSRLQRAFCFGLLIENARAGVVDARQTAVKSASSQAPACVKTAEQ
jgi:hypothetical protein